MNRVKHPVNHPVNHRESGASLIELQIGLAIGSLVLLGLVQLFISSRSSYQTQAEVSRLQENGRFAISFITREVRRTGSINITGTNESITATYPGSVDCTGADVAPTVINLLYISDDNLLCDGNGSSAQPMVEGVEAIRILYGVDTDSDTHRSVNKYVTSTDLSSAEWSQVVSVKVAVLLRTLKEVAQVSASQDYSLLDISYTTATDRYVRQLYSTTISLRF